jgi:hypothetical protein
MGQNAPLSPSIIRIGQLNVGCLVPKDHPSPMSVQTELSTTAKRRLSSACAGLFGPLCSANDSSVWFIRSLNIDLAVDVSWEAERVARAWAQPLARAVICSVTNGDDGSNVLRFPNRATYLSQFLNDLAAGAAWGKWYYHGFNGLRALPLSAAIRETICREPATGEIALQQLAANGRLDGVLRAMNETDCRSALTALCGAGRADEPWEITPDYLRVALREWKQTPAEYTLPNRGALRLYIALRKALAPVQLPVALVSSIRAVLALARWMISRQAGELLAALRDGDTVSAFSLVHSEDTDVLIALLRCDHSAVVDLAQEERSAAQVSVHSTSTKTGEQLFTSFGGIFWLLPHLDQLGLEECAATLPDFNGESPVALVRFLVMLKCLGAPRTLRAFFDPVLREVTGVIPVLNAQEVGNWARAVTPEKARAFQARWVACCRRRDIVDNRWLLLRSARRGRILVLSDGHRDTWLRATRSVDELVSALDDMKLDYHPIALLCDPTLTNRLPLEIGCIPVRTWDSPEAVAWVAEDTALATCLERARSPDQELNYLSLVSLLRSVRHVDLALSLAARDVLRAFAWRLPGFDWSSVDYLYANFLNVSASIQPEPDRWTVRLTRPPLHIVLRMTGGSEGFYSVQWLDERVIAITTIGEP